jgi:hypothetical protein
MDRAAVFGTVGCGFESRQAHLLFNILDDTTIVVSSLLLTDDRYIPPISLVNREQKRLTPNAFLKSGDYPYLFNSEKDCAEKSG